MLSIKDSPMPPPPLVRALEQVRRGADAMPRHQLEQVMEEELGSGWRERLAHFDDAPFAAASIGQVHRAKLGDAPDGLVAMKVQYPGVADSIDSDLNNLTMLMNVTGMVPPGLFLEEVVRVGRMELKAECDYVREMDNQRRFKSLVENDEDLVRDRVTVPDVIEDLTTSRVITSEFVRGGTIDKVVKMEQEERNRIGRAILRLTIRELFEWRFMQTDPNWGNFLYDVGDRSTHLIDFGAAREFDKGFVDGYLKIVWANAQRDEETLMDESHRMGFLTGEENDIMLEAHRLSGFTVGEPFASNEPYDFRRSNISARISKHSSAFLQHRLTPPPEEVYTLHRKLAGAYNLCIRLGAVFPCRDLLEEVMLDYSFDGDA
uniref:ABC1 atypical kinase-like domain-containing protein n=1 Tax=Odontella aurita TaxID=265563 RepID=A0A7S4J0P2_9STRA|mmetsp:Transcript_35084/g.104700  ORF Transcript_35084/g.104700 Transcript_35084/m.104700 type:complete len:375 (+) Transcript_35084:1-1125(+)